MTINDESPLSEVTDRAGEQLARKRQAKKTRKKRGRIVCETNRRLQHERPKGWRAGAFY